MPILHTCEDLVPILHISESLEPILHIVLVLYKLNCQKNVKFEHKFYTPNIIEIERTLNFTFGKSVVLLPILHMV